MNLEPVTDRLDTDKLSIWVVDNQYLHLVIHTDEEITSDDIPAVIGFLDLFDDPVPLLVERRGSYSISTAVQIAMYRGTKRRLKAVAFVDRHQRDSFLSYIAKITYFQHVDVEYFRRKEEAVDWLKQSFCKTPIKRDSKNPGVG